MPVKDEQILKHIGRDGLTIRAVLEQQYFDGRSCDHVINRLIHEKRVRSVNGLPGGLSYYHLSLTEARTRRVPEHRGRPRRRCAP